MNKQNVTTFNREYCKKQIWLVMNYHKAYLILYFLIDKMNNSNKVVCSEKDIQEDIGISQSTVTRGIKVLKEQGFIDIQKSGTSNVYHINPDFARNG